MRDSAFNTLTSREKADVIDKIKTYAGYITNYQYCEKHNMLDDYSYVGTVDKYTASGMSLYEYCFVKTALSGKSKKADKIDTLTELGYSSDEIAAYLASQ